jgi:hypothetical protein
VQVVQAAASPTVTLGADAATSDNWSLAALAKVAHRTTLSGTVEVDEGGGGAGDGRGGMTAWSFGVNSAGEAVQVPTIPIIGNGDILTWEDWYHHTATYGVSTVACR